MSSFAANAHCARETMCAHELMEETVSVINQALHEPEARKKATSRDALAEKISNGAKLRVRVLSADDLAEKGAVTLKFDDDRVRLLQKDSGSAPTGSTTVFEEHLVDVANDRDTYVKDPMKLELVWVKERMTAQEA